VPEIYDLFFGYDYFIAHRSVDGKPYAARLYEALTTEGNELDCFLDVKHYDAVVDCLGCNPGHSRRPAG